MDDYRKGSWATVLLSVAMDIIIRHVHVTLCQARQAGTQQAATWNKRKVHLEVPETKTTRKRTSSALTQKLRGVYGKIYTGVMGWRRERGNKRGGRRERERVGGRGGGQKERDRRRRGREAERKREDIKKERPQ